MTDIKFNGCRVEDAPAALGTFDERAVMVVLGPRVHFVRDDGKNARLVPRAATRLPGSGPPSAVIYGGPRLTLAQARELCGRDWSQPTIDGIFVHVDDLPHALKHGHKLWRKLAIHWTRMAISSGEHLSISLAICVVAAVPSAALLACWHWVGVQAAAGVGVGVLASGGVFLASFRK